MDRIDDFTLAQVLDAFDIFSQLQYVHNMDAKNIKFGTPRERQKMAYFKNAVPGKILVKIGTNSIGFWFC